MTVKPPAAAAILLCFCLMACGGGHGGPTAPAELQVKITTALLDTSPTATILEAKLLLDGKLATDASAGAGALGFLDLFAQGTARMDGQQHTLSVVIARQTVSPTPYIVAPPDISFFDASGNRVDDIRLEQRNVTLATGQGTDYTFTF
ncbi:MAG TPA: hypothetical protein VKY89_00905 [Thermoanaerobaculia bacterium]|jgi:hypothetical protein|nr:hypothetical protein [Thermoanaerobaculia bacterium]